MKKIIQMAAMVVVILMTALTAGAQKYMTRNGYIKFYSETPIETIQAENKQVNSALDLSSPTTEAVGSKLCKTPGTNGFSRWSTIQ
jgi:hypothetical protein